MRHAAGRRLAGALFGEVLPGGHALYFVRRGSGFPLSVGGNSAGSQAFWPVGDVRLHRHCSGGIFLCVEKGRAGLGSGSRAAGNTLMALVAAITDVEQLKSHPAVARLLAWN